MQLAALVLAVLALILAFMEQRRAQRALRDCRQRIEELDTERRDAESERNSRIREKRIKEAALVFWEEERLERQKKDSELEAKALECRTLIQQLKGEGIKPKKQGKSPPSKLPVGWVRALTDASIKKGALGVGVAFKREDGTTFETVSQPISYSGVEQDMQSKIDFAEGSAVLLAVKYARKLGVSGVQILTDSRNVVKFVNSKECSDSVGREIRAEANHLSEGILVEWISRDENTEAHDLANRGRREEFENKDRFRTSEAISVESRKQESVQPSEKMSSQLLHEEDLPEIPDGVKWLAECREPRGRDIETIRVGGSDAFSFMSPERVWEAVRARHGKNELEELKRQLRKNQVFTPCTGVLKSSGKTALRWCARGLPVELALRKASLSVHQGRNRTTKPDSRRVSACPLPDTSADSP